MPEEHFLFRTAPVKADKLDRTGQGWTGLEGAGSREGGACSKECTDVKIPGKKRRGGETGVRMEHPPRNRGWDAWEWEEEEVGVGQDSEVRGWVHPDPLQFQTFLGVFEP